MHKPAQHSHKRPADVDKDKQRRKEEESKRHKEAHAKAAFSTVDNRLKRETPFICTIKFKNDLPEIPCDPKMLVAPLQPEKLAEFSITTLETETKKDLILQPDLGIPISLLDAHRYQVPDNTDQVLDPADEEILAPIDNAALRGRAGKPKPKDESYKPWLLKTTYIADVTQTHRLVTKPKKPSQPLTTISPEDMRAQQIEAIEKSFAAAQKTPVHSTNPSLKPVEVLPVLPDLDNWKINYAYGNFESDPAEDITDALQHIPEDRHRTALDRFLFVRFIDPDQEKDEGGPRIALCIPNEVSDPSDATDISHLEGDYRWTREFMYNQFTDVNGQYLMSYGADSVTYCPLTGQTTFKKPLKKAPAKGEPSPRPVARPAKVVVSYREPNDAEQARFQKRLEALEEKDEYDFGDEQEEGK